MRNSHDKGGEENDNASGLDAAGRFRGTVGINVYSKYTRGKGKREERGGEGSGNDNDDNSGETNPRSWGWRPCMLNEMCGL